MKCLGFGSVQALWLGRLRYKERWQQAVNSKKTCFSYVPTQTSTSHNALRNHTELSQTALTSEEPLPTLALRPLSSSETVIIDCFFFFLSPMWWYFKVDSCVFVDMNQSVNKICSSLCRRLMILLDLEVPLSRWEILKWCISEYMCVFFVHLCVNTENRSVVQKSQAPPLWGWILSSTFTQTDSCSHRSALPLESLWNRHEHLVGNAGVNVCVCVCVCMWIGEQ